MAWSDLLAGLVEVHGTLTQVAWRLVEHLGDDAGDDVASIERALRRLRTRGQQDGGQWGQRVLRVFGVPVAIEERVRWMGLYHSPFNDLPVALCLDQLRLWDRPPVSASRARVWLYLGYASCAMRTRRLDDAAVHLERAVEALAALPAGYDAARIETALAQAYLASRQGPAFSRRDDRPDERERANPRTRARSAMAHSAPAQPDGGGDEHLERAAELLARAELADGDRDCFRARLADHRAYVKNHSGDPGGAFALYAALPTADTHPFASYRRDAGLAYGHHRAGRTAEALALAHRACRHAGDGGYTRLRAMGLMLVASIAGPSDGELDRARAIAVRLGDDELLARVDRRLRAR